MLAKLLLVKQIDFDFYKSIFNDPKAFNNYEKIGNSVIQKIFNATPLIQAGNHLRSFIYYKESDISLKLKGVGESLKVSLLENNSDSLKLLTKEMINNDIDHKKIRKFIINDLITDESIPTSEILNIINSISELNIKLTSSFADSIVNKISNYDIQHISNLDTQFVFQLLGECSKQLRKKLSVIYVRIINLKNADKAKVAEIDNYDQVVNESFKLLMTNSKKYQNELISLKEVIASTYFEDETLFNTVDNHGLTDKLITNAYITNLISSISKINLENDLFKTKINRLNKIIKLFNKQNSHEYFTKIHALISEIRTLPNDSIRSEFVTQISSALNNLLSNHLDDVADHPQREELGQFLLVLTTQENQVDQKLATIPSLYRLKPHITDGNR